MEGAGKVQGGFTGAFSVVLTSALMGLAGAEMVGPTETAPWSRHTEQQKGERALGYRAGGGQVVESVEEDKGYLALHPDAFMSVRFGKHKRITIAQHKARK